MGTEACRHGIADNIWIAALEKRIQGYENVVISDVRFPNEIDFVRSAGGVIIRVKRGEDPTPEKLATLHVSETAWNSYEPDYTVTNDGTIDELKEKIKLTLTNAEKPRTIFHHPV
jgi:rhodanese-related sulfurtransferase